MDELQRAVREMVHYTDHELNELMNHEDLSKGAKIRIERVVKQIRKLEKAWLQSFNEEEG